MLTCSALRSFAIRPCTGTRQETICRQYSGMFVIYRSKLSSHSLINFRLQSVFFDLNWRSSTGWNIIRFQLVMFQYELFENMYSLLGVDFGNSYDGNNVNASSAVWTCFQTVVLWRYQITLGGGCCGLLYPMWERDWCLWRGFNRKGPILLHLYV